MNDKFDPFLTPARPSRWSEISIRIDLDSHVLGGDEVEPKHVQRAQVQVPSVIPTLHQVLRKARDRVVEALSR